MTVRVEPGSEFDIEVHGITSEGAGVGRLPDGRAIFVHRTAPGDRIRVAVTRVAGSWARGRLVELLVEGPNRRPPPCPHYDRCGGCALEHLTYPAQVEAKVKIVTDALTRIGGLEAFPEPHVHRSPEELRYRNRVTFTLRRTGADGVVAGFRVLEHPDRVIDVDGRCLLPETAIALAWKDLRSQWGPGAARLPTGPELRLTLRCTYAGEVLLLIEGGKGRGDPEALLSLVRGLEAIWTSTGTGKGLPRLLAGRRIMERWYGEDIELHPSTFHQANRGAAVHLYDRVIQKLGDVRGHRVLDAYCGVGTFGRHTARHGAMAVGIEVDPGAAQVARTLPSSAFQLLEGRVEDRVDEGLPADIVILNPPRTGVPEPVVAALRQAEPRRIVYVSCDPATLARDVRRFTAGSDSGYSVSALEVFDLFPQTAHVETLLTMDQSRTVPSPSRGAFER